MPKVVINNKQGLIQKGGSGITIETDDFTVTTSITSNYVRFITGDYSGLSLATKTDANADSGFTFAANTYHEVAAVGDATNALVLPSAAKDTLVVWAFTGINDGGSNATVTTASGDYYEAQTLNFPTLGTGAAGNQGPRIFGTNFTTTQAAAKISTLTRSHDTLTIAMTATNNQSNIGAQLAFYCATKGYWRLMWQGAALGSGVMNATFAGSTA